MQQSINEEDNTMKVNMEKIWDFIKDIRFGIVIEPNSKAKINVAKNGVGGEINIEKDSEGKTTIDANFKGNADKTEC